MRRAIADQPHSAVFRARQAGIHHGDKVDAQVTLGVQPANHGRRPATVGLFCPSRISVLRDKSRSKGELIPMTSLVDFPNGLPRVRGPGLLRATMTIVSNGNLRFCSPRKALVVPVPEKLMDRVPWAYDGGAEDVAEFFGCASVDELFEKHGVPIAG